MHPAPPRIKRERLWCTGGSFTYRTSSVSPLLHAHTHSRAQLSHWPWFPVVTVCARVVGRAFLLSVLEILLIQLIHTNKQTDTRVDGPREGRTGGRKVSLLCGPSLQGSTRAGSPTFLLCLCSLTLKVHCVVTRRQLWDENLIAYWFWWLHKQNKHNRQNFLLFYCVDVGRSAIFLDSNSVLGPYYPWEVFSLYGNISNYYFWVCIVTLIF